MRKVYSIPEIASAVSPIAERYNIDKLYLFGSYARGEASSKSDVDFYIDNSEDLVGLFNLAGFLMRAKIALRRQCDLVTYDALKYDDDGANFLSNIERDKVLIYEHER